MIYAVKLNTWERDMLIALVAKELRGIHGVCETQYFADLGALLETLQDAEPLQRGETWSGGFADNH